MKVLVPLADGFEEIEAVTTVDILRRYGAEVTTASLKGKIVNGAHCIPIIADKNCGLEGTMGCCGFTRRRPRNTQSNE